MRTISHRGLPKQSCAQRTLLLVLVVAIFALTLNGCGWHLRGSMDLGQALPPLYLDIQSGSAELRSELPQTLRSAGVTLETLREKAALVLVVEGETQERRVLAVGSAGKVSEYELQYQLRFLVRDVSGKAVMTADTIRQQRNYSFNESEVLAKDEEQQQLFGFMRSMALQTLLRRLQGLAKLSAEGPSTEKQPGAD